jgi:hypothetical protein
MELVDKLHFKDELVMARDLQAQLVPRVVPEIGFFELGAFNRIANTVGGDLYAFEPLPDGRLAVLFGDASGHGMAAGLVMAVTHAVFRTQLPVDPSPAMMIASLNRVLCETGNARSFFPAFTPSGRAARRSSRPSAHSQLDGEKAHRGASEAFCSSNQVQLRRRLRASRTALAPFEVRRTRIRRCPSSLLFWGRLPYEVVAAS